MMRRHLLAFAFAVTAFATGCGGVEASEEISPSGSVEALATSCEAIQGRGCAQGMERACTFSNGAPSMCTCQEPMNTWACAPE